MNAFTDIVGHKNIINALKHAVKNGSTAHAYIFDGPVGVGKKSVAATFAKVLNCERGESEPCNRCKSCLTFDAGTNVNYYGITHEKKNITVGDIRTQINANVSYPPQNGKYKVFTVPDADLMNIEAQNALLKTLEEPPEYVVFLLICTNYKRLLHTIISRCMIYKFMPLASSDVINYAVENLKLGSESASLYARYASGSIGKLKSMTGSEEFSEIRSRAFNLFSNSETSDIVTVYSMAEDMKKYESNILNGVLDTFFSIVRDAIVYKQTGNIKYVMQSDMANEIKEISFRHELEGLFVIFDELYKVKKRLSANGDVALLTESLLMTIKENSK
ncbi:MAG TPA: DNA polymerase III subunit delta [Lachnospiraceae bacterium]|nr:DNA polymerase III subunit delta [Lachnospiraceae bacterium]